MTAASVTVRRRTSATPEMHRSTSEPSRLRPTNRHEPASPAQGAHKAPIAKFWMAVLTDLRNRGVKDTFFVVCDGLKGLPEVVGNVWPLATVQTCIIHLIRNTFRMTSRRYWDELKRDLKPVYTAVNAEAARAAFDELAAKWRQRYPAVVRLWENAWEEFIPFLDYDVEIRRVLCSTNAIESLNARYRRAVRARGHFPTEAAALKCLNLVTRSLDPTGSTGHDGPRAGSQHSTHSP
jgi:putative transposase